jgi:integrase
MAAIRQRNGKWQARVRRHGFLPVEKTFHSKQDAEKWARAIEREQDIGSYVCRSEIEQTTLSQLIQRYREEVVPLLRGAHTEIYRLANISQSQLGKLSLAALTPKSIANYRDQRLKAVSNSTVLRELQTLSAMLNHARREWGYPLVANPVQSIRRPAPNKGRARRLDFGEQQRLMQALECNGRNAQGQFVEGTRNPWIKPLVQLATETAMRRGELLGLKWQNINLEKRTVHLLMTKNGESRTVPLSLQAYKVLNSLPHSIDGRVFPITANALKHAWERACERAGVEDLHFHDLRHEATSRLAEKLTNVLELAAVTGHKDLKMLNRYYHPRAEDLAIKLL